MYIYIKQDWAAIVQLESLSSLGRPPALLFFKCPLQVTLNLLEVEAVPMVACHLLKEGVREIVKILKEVQLLVLLIVIVLRICWNSKR